MISHWGTFPRAAEKGSLQSEPPVMNHKKEGNINTLARAHRAWSVAASITCLMEYRRDDLEGWPFTVTGSQADGRARARTVCTHPVSRPAHPHALTRRVGRTVRDSKCGVNHKLTCGESKNWVTWFYPTWKRGESTRKICGLFFFTRKLW